MSYRRSRERNKRLKKLAEETKNSCYAGAYYCARKGRLVKYSAYSPWCKKRSRHMTRRKLKQDLDAANGCSYKKYHDYWWELL